MPIVVAPPCDHPALLQRAAESLQRFSLVRADGPRLRDDDRLMWYVPIPLRSQRASDSPVFGSSPLATFLTLEPLLIEAILTHGRPHCETCSGPTKRGNPSQVIQSLPSSDRDTFLLGGTLHEAGLSLGQYLELLQRDRVILGGEIISAEALTSDQRAIRGGGSDPPTVILQSVSAKEQERGTLQQECDLLLRSGFPVLDLFLVKHGSKRADRIRRVAASYLCERCQREATMLAYPDLLPRVEAQHRAFTLADKEWHEARSAPLSWWTNILEKETRTDTGTKQLLNELQAAIAAGFGDYPLTWDTRWASYEEGLRLALLVLTRAQLADAAILLEDSLEAVPLTERIRIESALSQLGAYSGQQLIVLGHRSASAPCSPLPKQPRRNRTLAPITYPAGPCYLGGEFVLPEASVTLLTGPSACGKTHFLSAVLAPFARSAEGKRRFRSTELILLPDKRPLQGACIATEAEIDESLAVLFAGVPESQSNGLVPGDFSLSTSQYQCPLCRGAGYDPPTTSVPTPPVVCPRCHGLRFQPPVSRIRFGEDTLAELLQVPMSALLERVRAHPSIAVPLVALVQAGFGALSLGYPLTSLSVAVRHRLRCVRALARGQAAKAACILLDLPYLGASVAERSALSELLHRAADAGHTIVLADSCPDPTLSPDSVLQFSVGAGPRTPYALQILRP